MIKETQDFNEISLTILDETVRPQDDYFRYVNNKWLAANPIPASESRWSSFSVLRNQAWANLRSIYEDLQSDDQTPGTIQQQAKDLYFTGMNVNSFSAKHLAIINKQLNEIEAVSDLSELARMFGALERMSVSTGWAMATDADDKNSKVHIVRLRQGGLSLPNRDYYLDDSSKMADVRAKFKTYAKSVYEQFPSLAGSFKDLWAAVFELETKMAVVSRTDIALRDANENYNKFNYAELVKRYPNIDWEAYAAGLNWQPTDQITVDQPEYLDFINKEWTEKTLNTWKTNAKWHFLVSYYGLINELMAQHKFEFFGKELSGTTEMMPLWKRVCLRIDDAIGEGVGRLYTEKHFPESSKKQVLGMVEEIRDEFKRRLLALDWMTEPTKKLAIEKLQAIKVLIGYPDKWRNYSKLVIDQDSYLQNIINATVFEHDYLMSQLVKPVSRDEWHMYPQTVNAYYDPNRQVICFPAGILQAPFYNPESSYAANMGGIGSVIGHEFTHGFDDQGCEFDAEGNMRQWQSPKDRAEFKKRAQVIIDHADKYEVLPGLFQRGGLVVGEAIADFGGLEIAFAATKTTLGAEKLFGKEDGELSEAEKFFITYGRVEDGQTRENKLRELALIDPHPESEYRVNGILQHCLGFDETYHLQPTDKLYLNPKSRANIW